MRKIGGPIGAVSRCSPMDRINPLALGLMITGTCSLLFALLLLTLA
jgi:hypothetical protein